MKCIFTGKDVTDLDEHVIPAWLQARLKACRRNDGDPPSVQHSNTSTIACRRTKTRNEFGKIENRIASGIFHPQEVYLCALKLHIGCIYRDASLRFDIKDPSSPFIMDVADFGQDVWLFQQLFALWLKGGATDPAPFGSVFVLDALHPAATFDFIHCLVTGVVGVSIGEKFILVFLWDQGDVARSNFLEIWGEMAHSADPEDGCVARLCRPLLYGSPHVGLRRCIRCLSASALALLG